MFSISFYSSSLDSDARMLPMKTDYRSLASKLVSVVMATFALSISAMSQNKLSFAGGLIKLGDPPTKECLNEIHAFTKLAILFLHPPTGWDFVIVCDEVSWLDVTRRIFPYQDLREHYGETDIDKSITLIRGYRLLNADRNASAELIVAHELAHIMLRSRDEKKVD